MGKTLRAYKLLRLRKDLTLGPLFINRRQVIPFNEWLQAGCYPTKGYAVRPGWHAALKPYAPHLTNKGRVWAAVEVRDYEILERPESQGGLWVLAQQMRVLGFADGAHGKGEYAFETAAASV